MDKNYRPYWKRHRIQLRLVSLLMLLVFPLIAVGAMVIDNWNDIKDTAKTLAADAFLPHKGV
jgi:DNA-binding helix-hairpin-helix protein with protein kinase domain